jgi:hypothetical protein
VMNRMLTFSLILIMVAPLTSRATGQPESTAVSPDSTVTNTVELPAGWDELRDPLWPIGYTPPPPPTAPSATDTAVVQKSAQALLEARAVWPSLKLKALTKDSRGGYMAVIDGIGVVEEGEIVRIQAAGIVYRWRIEMIGPTGLKAKRLTLKAVRRP